MAEAHIGPTVEQEMERITVRIPEACRLTGIKRSKFYQLIQQGEIKIIKVGSITLVPVAALRSFLAKSGKV